MKLTPIKIPKVKRKKSGFEDMFFVMVVIFGVVLFLIILGKVWSEIRHPLEGGLNSTVSNADFNMTKNFDRIGSTITLFDKLLPLLMIGLFGFVLIGAAMYMQHPIMIFAGIIIIAVAILLAVIYSNIYHQIADSTEFESTTNDFPISDKFMEFLPFVVFIMAIGITAAVIWAKKTGSVGGL